MFPVFVWRRGGRGRYHCWGLLKNQLFLWRCCERRQETERKTGDGFLSEERRLLLLAANRLSEAKVSDSEPAQTTQGPLTSQSFEEQSDDLEF